MGGYEDGHLARLQLIGEPPITSVGSPWWCIWTLHWI